MTLPTPVPILRAPAAPSPAGTEIVVADIGGTHARFAIARINGPRVEGIAHEVVLKTGEHDGLKAAWDAYASQAPSPLPHAAAFALAGPVNEAVLRLTNSPWVIRPAQIAEDLGLSRHCLVNDFAAVAHAVARLDTSEFRHLCGPDAPLPESGVISVVGPGTGLGVAAVARRDGATQILETEGGHVDFAPLDDLDDRLLGRLRALYGRTSVERVVSGPGLVHIYAALTGAEAAALPDDTTLWRRALSGGDPVAEQALDRFCLNLGAVAGDIALIHGAQAVVIGGGLGLRLADRLANSGFAQRFCAKGRFEARMAGLPVKLITYPEPGLYGAAAAFAQAYG